MSEQGDALGALRLVFQKVTQENLNKLRAFVDDMKADNVNAEAVDEIYRMMHDLKGQAGAFEYEELGVIASTFCAYLVNCGVVPGGASASEVSLSFLHVDFFANVLQESFDLGGRFPSGWSDFVEELEEDGFL